MIAAAKADGEVSAEERAAIDGQSGGAGAGRRGCGADRGGIGRSAGRGPDCSTCADGGRTALTQIYAATLMIVDETNPAEKGYLAMLAARMNLDQGLVDHLHVEADRL